MATKCPIHFDPLSLEQLANPYPLYETLREESPVHYEPALDLWVVTRHEDVTRVALNTADFSSVGSIQSKSTPPPPEVQQVLDEGIGEMLWMTSSDDPDHKRVRGMVNKVFTPRRVQELEPQIAHFVNTLIDEFIEEGTTDIIESFAWPLPLWGLAEILGIPRTDIAQLHEWSYHMLRLLQATDPLDDLIRYAEHFVALQHYVLDALEERIERPRHDLMSALLEARHDADPPLSVPQTAWVPINLIVAGHVTVTRAIGNGLALLFHHPELRERLEKASESEMANAVEEILRYESPAQGLFRTALRDVDVGSVTIPEGSKVMIHFGSANRDPEVFEHPEIFDPTRPDARHHVAFGKGIHFCVGAPLARTELRLSFRGLLDRLPNLRSGGPGTRDTIFFARGWSHLPVAWDAPTR